MIKKKKNHHRQKPSIGDILRKFDTNWTFLKDLVCLLSSITPKIGAFHAALQTLRRGQNCEFPHIKGTSVFS